MSVVTGSARAGAGPWPDRPASLAALVTWRASRTPDREALVGSSRRWTWAELDRDVRTAAAALVDLGVPAGGHVGIVRSKTAESLLAVWAVLTAGAVAVPIDAASAESAVAVARVAELVAVVVDARRRPWFADDVPTADVAELVAHGRMLAEPVAASPGDPAYLIFTSGSTGTPKGIVHTHASGLRYAEAVVDTYGFDTTDRVAGMSPLHFDMSTLELYAAPLAGAAIVVMDEPLMRFPASFTARSADEGVTVWYTVPFFLQQVAARGALETRDLGSLRWLLYGGEPYSPGALHHLVQQLPSRPVVSNVYGPAEVNQCTVWCCPATELDPDAGDVPLGRAWNAAEVAVVDGDGNRVLPGEQGELVVRAETVMQGYWRRPDLTAARLRPRPALGDGLWYDTGDLAWEDADGMLHYAGRRDHQVKVRGIRMELEGIEAVLADAPGVLAAVAAPTADRDGIVVAVVPRDGTVDVDAVLGFARGRLHPLAVPAHVTIYPSFPSTQSGKIDRRRVRAELQDLPT
jgi:amino acid adenylation domain-containing protein